MLESYDRDRREQLFHTRDYYYYNISNGTLRQNGNRIPAAPNATGLV